MSITTRMREDLEKDFAKGFDLHNCFLGVYLKCMHVKIKFL